MPFDRRSAVRAGGHFRRPLFRGPDEDSIIGFAVLRFAPTASVANQMVAGNHVLNEEARSIGGTLYPFAVLRLCRADWERHYGPEAVRLIRAKRRDDSDNILASGPDAFGNEGDSVSARSGLEP
jgi:hypothetical protein